MGHTGLGVRVSPGVTYWITPVSGDEIKPGEETIKTLVAEKKIFGLGPRTPGRVTLKPNDWVCFYVTGKGVVAHARAASRPEKHPELVSVFYPFAFHLDSISTYLSNPIAIDTRKRVELDAFKEAKSKGSWGWFVTTTHRISKHDFELLTLEPPTRE
jgi:hypothetical protein